MTLMTLATQDEPVPAKAESAELPWFASYPPGVPKTIDPDAYPSLTAMLVAACRQHAERPAFECLGAQMTFAEWDRDGRDFAARFWSRRSAAGPAIASRSCCRTCSPIR